VVIEVSLPSLGHVFRLERVRSFRFSPLGSTAPVLSKILLHADLNEAQHEKQVLSSHSALARSFFTSPPRLCCFFSTLGPLRTSDLEIKLPNSGPK